MASEVIQEAIKEAVDETLAELIDYQSNEAVKKLIIDAQVKILNWVIQVNGSGYTSGTNRIIFHNKIVELTGNGQKA